MSERVTLKARGVLERSIDLDALSTDRTAVMSSREIEQLPVWCGRTQACVGDFFNVSGGRSRSIHVEGATVQMHGIGTGTAGGEVIVDGDVGDRLGARMAGGRISVTSNAGADAGMAMSGGQLIINRSAGPRLGGAAPGAARGMTGGEIVVGGDAGPGAASLMRRGLVVVSGRTGEDAARGVIAGTLVCIGDLGARPGRGNKRGSIVALGAVAIPDSYTYACTLDAHYVRLLLTYLCRNYQWLAPTHAIGGLYRRYCGDNGRPGKGEILQWTGR